MAIHTKQFIDSLVSHIKRSLDSDESAPDGRVIKVTGLRTEETYDLVNKNFDQKKYFITDELVIKTDENTLADSTRCDLYFRKKV